MERDGNGRNGNLARDGGQKRIDENYDAYFETKFKSNLIIQPIIV